MAEMLTQMFTLANKGMTVAPAALTCCGLLTLVKRPPELHRLAALLYLLFNLPQLCPDLWRKEENRSRVEHVKHRNEQEAPVTWRFESNILKKRVFVTVFSGL